MPTEKEILKRLKDECDSEIRYCICNSDGKRIIDLFFHSEANAINYIYDMFPKDRGVTKKLIENMVAQKKIIIKGI